MGLDITVMERRDVRCPHCGEVINTVDVVSTGSGGRLWYDFLERLGVTMFPMRSVPRRTTGTARTWFLTTSRQSSSPTMP